MIPVKGFSKVNNTSGYQSSEQISPEYPNPYRIAIFYCYLLSGATNGGAHQRTSKQFTRVHVETSRCSSSRLTGYTLVQLTQWLQEAHSTAHNTLAFSILIKRKKKEREKKGISVARTRKYCYSGVLSTAEGRKTLIAESASPPLFVKIRSFGQLLKTAPLSEGQPQRQPNNARPQ